MQTYRIYLADPDGQIAEPPINVRCLDDTEALSAAQRYLDGRGVEIWKGARLIAHLDPMHHKLA
jgi:hypothetical protein